MISASCPVPARDAAGVCSSSRPSPQACSRPHGLRLPPPQLGSIHHDLVTTASRKAVHLACWSSAGNGTAYPIASPNPHCRRVFRLLPTALARPRTPIAPLSPLPKLLVPHLHPHRHRYLHSRSCTVGTLPPAISCLGASRTPPVAARG